MFKLLLICTLMYYCFCEPRSPKVYNVLITSKKNLSPSQAVPVYQPVLRTTSVGLAFTPFLYTHLAPVQPAGYFHPGPIAEDILTLPKELQPQQENDANYNNQQPAYTGRSLPSNVVPLQQYVPVYSPQVNYQQYLLEEKEDPQTPRQSIPSPTQSKSTPVFSQINPLNGQPLDPKEVIANLKRNPEIPDVPPPPLPTRAI